jgi:hypothetical protein
MTTAQLKQLMSEMKIEQSRFGRVVDTLTNLHDIDTNVMESMFYYKWENMEAYVDESHKLVRDFKLTNQGVKTNNVAYKLKKNTLKKKKNKDL